MKITYRIEQYDVDDFRIIITSPKYLEGVCTRIHSPHFLLSELQQHIKTNLNQTIRRFCIKHKQYADILHNETFEFEPDEYDRRGLSSNPCWFYTGKFINDTEHNFSDEEKNAISYENLIRYDNAYAPSPNISTRLIVDPRWMKNRTGPIKIKSLEPNKAIDVSRVRASLGLKDDKIYKFVQNQKHYAPNKGNSYGQQIFFPRHKKDKNDHVCFPITELQKYISLLYQHKQQYPHLRKLYESIKKSLIDYTNYKNRTAKDS